MNRFNWTYVGDAGRQHQVGIAHFPHKSGHLLIYCNSKIIAIDFSVFESKSYSFFIEEELCEVQIEKKDDLYFYNFHINKEADTPRNRVRKQYEQNNLRKGLLFVATVLAAVGLMAWLLLRNRAPQQAVLDLSKPYISTPVKVFLDTQQNIYTYSYVAHNQVYKYQLAAAKIQKATATMGLPIGNGDEFTLLYAPKHPQTHLLDLLQPSDLQMKRYKAIATQMEVRQHPHIDSTQAACRVEVGFEIRGIAALADFYHQQKTAQQNTRHNIDSYHRLVRAIPFQKAAKQNCW